MRCLNFSPSLSPFDAHFEQLRFLIFKRKLREKSHKACKLKESLYMNGQKLKSGAQRKQRYIDFNLVSLFMVPVRSKFTFP